MYHVYCKSKTNGDRDRNFSSKRRIFSEEKASLATTQVFEEFRRLESIFSRFQSDSELSHLNQVRESFISEELQQVLTFSLQIAHETNGVFNPLVNLSALGYSNDFGVKLRKKNAKALLSPLWWYSYSQWQSLPSWKCFPRLGRLCEGI